VRRTPKFALALLQSCECADSLIGDLLEECERGRSRAWLLRQVVAAAAAAMFAGMSNGKRLAVESAIVGWALLYLFNVITHQLITAPLVFDVFGGTGLGAWGIALANAPDLIIPPFAASFVVARLHPRVRLAMAAAFIASFFVVHAGTVAWLTTSGLLHDQPISWTNVLNVPFTLGLMLSGGVLGSHRAARSI
jgi:uncharacterized membrane protein YjjP (DUF1212 family)